MYSTLKCKVLLQDLQELVFALTPGGEPLEVVEKLVWVIVLVLMM